MSFPKPCTECGALSDEAQCPTHRAQKQALVDQRRKEEEPWRRIFSTKQWFKARQKTLIRDDYQCVALINGVRCENTTGLQAHHILPLSKGGAPYSLANLVTLCSGCHASVDRATRKRTTSLGITNGGNNNGEQ